MLSLFTKSVEAVTAADVQELREQAWPEGYQVEFKKTLPTKNGQDDRWIGGADGIGDYARDQILSEVVAFANAQGGTLVLGIEETKDKPPRAQAVAPLPRVGELARRFEDQARSCIDPPLPRLQVRAIETDAAKGVVIFRTGPSRSAPHRLTTTLDAYKRHGSSTMKMTMREIQEMSLTVARGLADIGISFDIRRNAFLQWARDRARVSVVACRVTAIPLEPLADPGRLSNNPGLFPVLRNFTVTNQQGATSIGVPASDYRDRPILRGIARTADTQSGGLRVELHQSGLIDMWFCSQPREIEPGRVGGVRHLLHHRAVLGAAMSVIWLSKIYRFGIGMPDAEYALETEIGQQGSPTPIDYIGLFDVHTSETYHLSVTDLPRVLPRLPVGAPDSFGEVLNQLDLDIFDALEIERPLRSPLTLQL
jgi:hypothetical protein